MSDAGSPRSRVSRATTRRTRTPQPTRKLRFTSRVRERLRYGADRLLAADAVWSGAFVLVMLAVLGTQRCDRGLEQFVVGQAAPRDLRASYDIEVVDETLTEERRRQARERIPQVYTYDTEQRIRLAGDLARVFEEGRRSLEEAALQGLEEPAVAARQTLADRLPPAVLDILLARDFDPALERELTASVNTVLRGLVVGNKAVVERQPEILLVQLPDKTAETVHEYVAFVDMKDARELLRHELEPRIEASAAQREALIEFAASFIDANVHLDAEQTARRRDAAAAAVPPTTRPVARGGIVIHKGERVTEEKLQQLAAARVGASPALGLQETLALVLVVSMLAFFLFRYSRYHQRGFRRFANLHALLVLVVLGMVLISKALLWVAGELVDGLAAPFDALAAYVYLVPVGAGAILITLLANGRIAMVYSAFTAIVLGATHGDDYYLALWALLVQLSGVYAISTYRERASLLRAGLVVGGAAAVTALALETLKGDLEPLSKSLYGAGLAFIGGALGAGLLISFSLPLLEGLFRVLTDIRLLELSNLNNPLLSQLAVKAPGSYNHSLVVGMLADEAANAIGANRLFCRVAAFYHDIGKINHPEYFVENQRGINPHDRLAPSMSALIIASHVKDGIKMAREAGLPQQIIDIIPQHHGTRLMTFFYEKARSNTSPSLGPVKQEDFRYPGPKPQTKEAAIFMLSDAVEAAARTVDEPTANRLREMIRKVTNVIVLDGQLDSCDLTFADLEKIQQSFLRLLVSMYHHRVDYPGFDFRRDRGEAKAEPLADPKLAETRPHGSPDGADRKLARGR